ncbi:MAG: thymidine kinase [Alphaproteobacteria bacterium]|nr:thymidine kinase [Alphaproteobacteria bacterium]
MATLHFHYGVMSSSKSARLIINAYNYNQNGIKTQVIKPSFDTRFSDTTVKSRIGIETPALALQNLNAYIPTPGTRVVLVDEVQFFSPSDIDKLVRIADDLNITVMCYGLLNDSNEQMFPASKRLIEVGAELHLHESNCQINGCMELATHHLRFDTNGNIIHAGDQFALGDSNYKSVCRQHYNMLYHGIGQKVK